MGKQQVYVETTIPSFYHEVRKAPAIVARRKWTRQWWKTAADRYDLVTSDAVLNELASGPPGKRKKWLSMLRDLPLVPVAPEIGEIVRAYVTNKLMPADPSGDALHLALASFHKCDFLVTWNCKHLANANKFGHVRRLNVMLGLFVPALVTPLELLGGDDEKRSDDPVIDEIREIRHRISARFNHDPVKLVAYYMEQQKQHKDRLLDPKKARGDNSDSAI